MIFVVSIIIILAVYSTKLSTRLGIPILLVFLMIGIVTGSDILNLIDFDDMRLTQEIANLALVFIIFESGFQLKGSSLRSVLMPAMTLSTLGVIVMTLFMGTLIHYIIETDWVFSMLIGAIISSTDASGVITLLRQNPVRSKVSDTLEVESVTNDPAAILLTIFMIQLVLHHSADIPFPLISLIWQLVGGVGVGIGVAWLGRQLFNHLKSQLRGNYYILIIGLILFSAGLASLVQANQIIAAFFSGVGMGNMDFDYKRGINHFIDGIASFATICLFLMLGWLVFPSNFISVWHEGILIALAMIVLARPLMVFLCTLVYRYDWREKAFLAWAGLKGAVPIVLATYPAAHGLDDQHYIFNLVFFAVLISLLLQGLTINPIAGWLRLRIPSQKNVLYSMELFSLSDTNLEMSEIYIDRTFSIVNRRIASLNLPANILITTIVRNNKVILPKGHTQILAEDLVFVLLPKNQIEPFYDIYLNQNRVDDPSGVERTEG
ncbi:MAG: potassium/proton antiporter [Candidatus Delongbacteria bacterium]|nr:potassium/proton antiporter [Candidatus Delongbacteria bacterium]